MLLSMLMLMLLHLKWEIFYWIHIPCSPVAPGGPGRPVAPVAPGTAGNRSEKFLNILLFGYGKTLA